MNERNEAIRLLELIIDQVGKVQPYKCGVNQMRELEAISNALARIIESH